MAANRQSPSGRIYKNKILKKTKLFTFLFNAEIPLSKVGKDFCVLLYAEVGAAVAYVLFDLALNGLALFFFGDLKVLITLGIAREEAVHVASERERGPSSAHRPAPPRSLPLHRYPPKPTENFI